MHKKGWDWDFGAGPGGGLGTMHGSIASPAEACGYEVSPGSGGGAKGGEPQGPFGKHRQTESILPIIGRDSLGGNLGTGGDIATPMSTSGAAMPGLSGSDGTGQTGEGKISSPWSDTSYAGRDGSSTRNGGGSAPTNTPGMG